MICPKARNTVPIQLRSIWDHIQPLPSPLIFGSVNGGPLRHRFFLWLELDPRIN
ncbi:hypothetical protein F4861DRAFT_509904 [Xylaria intraflava]|nr:hypothetical protein F4861DRAFT_509904 [Xylaria intraflava]